jgi:hypothetical protein
VAVKVAVGEGIIVLVGGMVVGILVGMLVAAGIGAAVGLGVQPESTRLARIIKTKMDLKIFDGFIAFLLVQKMLVK